jgi:hypothetical protein
VIPRDYITEWRARAPWTDDAQVEQRPARGSLDQLKLERMEGKAYCALPDPTVVIAPFGALGIACSNSGNKTTRSPTRLDLALSKMTAISNFGRCC